MHLQLWILQGWFAFVCVCVCERGEGRFHNTIQIIFKLWEHTKARSVRGCKIPNPGVRVSVPWSQGSSPDALLRFVLPLVVSLPHANSFILVLLFTLCIICSSWGLPRGGGVTRRSAMSPDGRLTTWWRHDGGRRLSRVLPLTILLWRPLELTSLTIIHSTNFQYNALYYSINSFCFPIVNKTGFLCLYIQFLPYFLKLFTFLF